MGLSNKKYKHGHDGTRTENTARELAGDLTGSTHLCCVRLLTN